MINKPLSLATHATAPPEHLGVHAIRANQRLAQTTPAKASWPGGKRFAFTIVDDTDGGNLQKLKPIYSLLREHGLLTTKTVWPISEKEMPCYEMSLENDDYLRWILDLRNSGVEIATHGATDGTSTREKILEALNFFRLVIGQDPRVHTNHVGNRDNLYWYEDRLVGLPRKVYRAYNNLWRKRPESLSLGHVEDSECFWGDICRQRISYVRNFVFNGINTIAADPWMPYHSAVHPFVRSWFSASDGSDLKHFNQLISEKNQDRLIEEGGACIVYTHFGFGFCEGSKVNSRFAALIRRLARLPGYFVPASTLLDQLRFRRGGPDSIRSDDLRLLQRRWMRDKVLAHV